MQFSCRSCFNNFKWFFFYCRSPVTLLGHGTCLEPSTRCATTGRSVCHIPFGAWKLDSARYSFDKHCLSTFCPPSIHRLSSAADAFHRSAAAAAAVAAAAVNGTGGGVGTTGGGGGGGGGTSSNSSSSNSNNNGTTNASGSTIGTGPSSASTDSANAAAACYSLHNSAAASVAAAVSSFIPTISSHSGVHAGPHHHTSSGATPSLIQAAAAAAAAAARQQPYLTDAKHAALTFTSPLSGAQKLLPSAEAFPPMLPVFSDSLSQLNYGRKVFPCPQCRYTTDRRNNLKRHMLTMHQACSKLLECCGILFTTKASLREHALIFHYHGYTCYYCGRRFCRKALLSAIYQCTMDRRTSYVPFVTTLQVTRVISNDIERFMYGRTVTARLPQPESSVSTAAAATIYTIQITAATAAAVVIAITVIPTVIKKTEVMVQAVPYPLVVIVQKRHTNQTTTMKMNFCVWTRSM